MRRCIALISIVCLLSIVIAGVAQEPFALEELHLVRWEQVPEGKPSHTGPVSAAVLMAWYAEHGYPALLPDLNGDGRIDEEDTILLSRDFGEEMQAVLIDDRLADPFIVYPLARYVAERYPDEFRMLVYDESFPEEVARDLGQSFNPDEVPGIVIEVHDDPFYELYVEHLEAWRPGIVGIGFDIPEWNDFTVSRSYIPGEEPEGWPVDLVGSGEQFTPEPVWETFLRLDPEQWGFLTPEWVPFEILIILLPIDEFYSGDPGQPGDGPGDDPGDGPGGDPGDDPGGDPGDDPGDDPRRYPDPGDGPGGDPRFPSGSDDEGVCCMPDGACDTTTADECARRGGAFVVNETCATYVCPRIGEELCSKVEGEITDICYTYENGVLKVFASYAIYNKGSVAAKDITAIAGVGLNDGVNGLGGGPDCQDWRYGLDIPAGGTYAYSVVFTSTAPTLDLSKLTYLYGSLWLQKEAPWDCWGIAKQAFVQTWDPAPLCYPQSGGDPGTPPGGSGDPAPDPSDESADVRISMQMVSPENEPVSPGSQIQYNLNVWQAGPDTAKNVVVELTIPSSASINASGGSAVQIAHRPPNDILRWNLGDLVTFPPGTSIWLQVNVDQDACGAIQYDFSVTSDTFDPDLSNNTGSLATQIGPCDGEPGTPPGGRDEGEPGQPSGGTDGVLGACCLPDGSCESLDETECQRRDGLFYGPGTACSEIRCFPPEPPPCPIIYSRVTDACQLYQGPNQPMIVRADFELRNPGTKDAVSVGVKLVAGVPLLSNLMTTYTDIYEFTIPVIPAGGSHKFSHTFSIAPAPPQQPTGQTVVMVFAVPVTPLCKPNIQSAAELFHLLTFGPSERICPDGEGTPPGGDENEPPGACCLPSGQCIETGITNCDSQGGEFRGEGSSCEGSDCPSGSSDGSCPAISAYVEDFCYQYSGPDQPLTVQATFAVENFGTATALSPWVEAEATCDITINGTTTTYRDTYSFSGSDIPPGGELVVTHEFNLGAVPQPPTDYVTVHVLSRITSPCLDYTETTGTGSSNIACPIDGSTGEPGEPGEPAEPGEPEPEPDPDPETGALPNLWVTNVTGCWDWSSDGQEHVIARVSGTVHNGGQASASNVKARLMAGGKTTWASVGTISAGGQKTVSATIDVGAYDSVSWPVSISVTADHTNSITEADETNNTTKSSFPENSDCN